LWTDMLQRDVAAAKKETEEARQEVTDNKQTVASLECELRDARDVERIQNEQVTHSRF